MSCKPPYKRGHGGYCGCDCKCLAPECWDLIKVNYSCESSGPGPAKLQCPENNKICPGFGGMPEYCQDISLPCIGFDCQENGCEKAPYITGMYYTYNDCIHCCENSKKYKKLIPHKINRAVDERICQNGICPEEPTWVCCLDGIYCAATHADCPNCECEGKKGCTNPHSNNYDPDAKCDDGSCVTCCNASKCVTDDRDNVANCNRLPLLDGFQGGSDGCCDAFCLEAGDCHPTFTNSYTVPAANSCSGKEFTYGNCESCINTPAPTPTPTLTPPPEPTPPPPSEEYCYYCKYVPYGFNIGDGGVIEEDQTIEYQTINAQVMTPVCKQVKLPEGYTCELLGDRDGVRYYDNLDDCFRYCDERKYCYKCEYTDDPNYGICTEVDLPEGYTCDMLSSRDGITYYESSDVCMKNCGDPTGYKTCYYCVKLYSYGVCNQTYIPYGQCGDYEYYENYDTCYNVCNPTTTTTTTTTTTPEPSYCTIEVTTDGCCLELDGSTIYAVGDGAVSAQTSDQDCCDSPEEYDILVNGERDSTTVTDGEVVEITIDTDKSEKNCICTEKKKEPSQKSSAGCPKNPGPRPVVVLDKKTNKIKILINKTLIR